MHLIEQSLRKAIAGASANSPEDRSNIYLKARKAIQKLPPEKSELAMQHLFDAVKAIEAEYVEIELPSPGNARDSESKSKKITLWAAAKKGIAASWKRNVAIAIVFAAMFFSGHLLFTQLNNLDFDKFTIGSPDSKRIDNLFQVSGKEDLELLSADPKGTRPLALSDTAETSPGLRFRSSVKLYGKEPVSIEPEQFYLVRLQLNIIPVSAPVTLKAGFVHIGSDGTTVTHANLLYSGAIQAKNFQNDTQTYQFSRLIGSKDLKDALKLDSTSAKVKPFIHAKSGDKSTKIEIMHFVVELLP